AACGFEVASIDGDVMDFEITANRPDCLSVYGLAREASAAFDLDLTGSPAGVDRPGHASIPVSIGDAGCGRYALALATVTVGPSPAWLADRLSAAGVRPINNVVDVTNYVMIETGHPMHAFDVARLSGPEIRVRRARAGEKLTTLDGIERTLDETMLVIADRERAVAIAGVMGGLASEVAGTTSHVALESAWFVPASVRATSRKLGLKTEASARFERGADITAPVRALGRALELLTKIGAGSPVGGASDVYPRAFEPRVVALSRTRLAQLLGDRVPDADVSRILERLGFRPVPAADGWQVSVPAFRIDVSREADLIEEVGRHWGLDRIPATFPALHAPPREMSPVVARDRLIRRVLCGAGLQETCTFTFIENSAAEHFSGTTGTTGTTGTSGLVEILNPLSEKFAVLRPSLLPGLLDALVYSRRRETEDIRIFEAGAAFLPTGEVPRVAWAMTGKRTSHWGGDDGPVDFFDAKGIAELLADAFGVSIVARPTEAHPWFVRGRAADLFMGDDGAGPSGPAMGSIGQLRPELASARGLSAGVPVYGGELDPAALQRAAGTPGTSIDPLPRFPSIVRDLSIFVDERLPAADLRGTIRSVAPPMLVSVREFDRYDGKGVPEGQISLSIRLTFRDRDRTLTDSEVQLAVDTIVTALEARHGAVLRGK
ncbi:MAG TPA: phenylalanine--tRNA ligase subunit beta, partial [Vicinamibacterales bacterium]|nr:phenylalanine--tRNA ligase subunit beta [Vicinamibacterales bacterium]